MKPMDYENLTPEEYKALKPLEPKLRQALKLLEEICPLLGIETDVPDSLDLKLGQLEQYEENQKT
jgi:hypothetical protein